MNMMSENNQKSKIGEKQHYLEELEIKKIKEDEKKELEIAQTSWIYLFQENKELIDLYPDIYDKLLTIIRTKEELEEIIQPVKNYESK